MHRYAAIFFVMMISCTAPTRFITYTSSTVPVIKIDPQPQKIMLLSVYDLSTKHYRDNKEELFQRLIDTTMQWAAQRINDNYGIPTEVITGYTGQQGKKDSAVHAAMVSKNATHAIAVDAFDVRFDQTRVDVTRTSGGNKNREAFYDIINDMSFLFYDTAALLKEKDIHLSRYHSSRSVVSGLLAAGPNVVAQRNDAYRIALQSWEEYLQYFFPGQKPRSRPVFVGKGFESISQALARNDYEAALIENLRFIDDPDKKKAAMANYNCAVLMERKDQHEEAKKYLARSLSLMELKEAALMRMDYQ